MIVSLLVSLLSMQEASPLDVNAPTSDYRAVYIEMPADSFRLEEVGELILVDAGNIERRGDVRLVPIVSLRPRSLSQPDREILIYQTATVRCYRDYETDTPRYENAAGMVPLSVEMDWRPVLPTAALEIFQEIVCSPDRAGVSVGRKTRQELIEFLNATE